MTGSGRAGTRLLGAVCSVIVMAACASTQSEPGTETPAAQSSDDGAAYRQSSAGAWFPNNVATLDELIDTSSAIILGDTVSVEIGRTIDNGDQGTVYYADALVSVTEQLPTTSGEAIALEDDGLLRVEFFLGFDRTLLSSLDALLPREPALWFVQSPEALFDVMSAEAGIERDRFPESTSTTYMLTDYDAGLITEEPDGTRGFPLVEPVEPHPGPGASVPPPFEDPPEDPEDAAAMAASFPTLDDTLPFSDLLERLRN